MNKRVCNLSLLIILMLVCISCGSFAQLPKKQMKQIRKEAKTLAKEGWKPAHGEMPIEKQLEKSFLMQLEYDENMSPKYIMGVGISTCSDYATAKTRSTAIAKQDMVGQMETNVAAIIDQHISNKQISAVEVETVSQMVMNALNQVSKNIDHVIPVMEIYRVVSNGNTEVQVQLAYKSEELNSIVERELK